MASTREKWWFLGHPEKTITGARLPSRGQVLRNYYYYHTLEGMTKPEAVKKTMENVFPFWEAAGSKTSRMDYCKKKLLKLIDEYDGLKKNRRRDLDTDKMKEDIFEKDLVELFDIGHKNASKMTSNNVDKAFLDLQREDRYSSCMIGRDAVSAAVYSRKKQREDAMILRKAAAELEIENNSAKTTCLIDLESRSNELRLPPNLSYPLASSDDSDTEDPDFVYKSLTEKRIKKPKRYKNAELLSTDVTNKLDRHKVSNSAAMSVLASVAQASGQKLDDVTLSRSSIFRYRNRNRISVSSALQIDFPENCFVQVHWDAKQMPGIKNKNERVERLAIAVTGGNREYFLAGTMIERGTAICMATAVMNAIRDSALQDRILGIGFDTTASNTGSNGGACKKIQESLGKNILWMACRHHILEVVLSAVFKDCYGISDGPNISIFGRFKKNGMV